MTDEKLKYSDERIAKRSFHGSLVLFFILFAVFIFKSSNCIANTDIITDNGSDQKAIDTIKIGTKTKPEITISEPEKDEKRTQKNKIKDLTVSKNLVNINTATAEELISLKGIGEKTAAEIVKYRELNGSFKTADDLLKVKGIGKAKVSAISDKIVF
jgi:competence protein ComEA